MNKDHILTLKKNYKFNDIELGEVFQDACEHAYVVRNSTLSPMAQLRCRARNLAFPLVALWTDVAELLEKID